jgi:hypothetical protein
MTMGPTAGKALMSDAALQGMSSDAAGDAERQ